MTEPGNDIPCPRCNEVMNSTLEGTLLCQDCGLNSSIDRELQRGKMIHLVKLARRNLDTLPQAIDYIAQAIPHASEHLTPSKAELRDWKERLEANCKWALHEIIKLAGRSQIHEAKGEISLAISYLQSALKINQNSGVMTCSTRKNLETRLKKLKVLLKILWDLQKYLISK